MTRFEPPLHYCALHYAELWFGTERALFSKLESRNPEKKCEALAAAATYFRVARSLPRKADSEIGKGRCRPILDILQERARRPKDTVDMIDVVRLTSDKMGAVYGGTPLSAASKFLWLRYRDPFVIFDSQVRRQLGTRDSDYRQFVAAWEENYNSMQGPIREACIDLPALRSYLLVGNEVSDCEMLGTVTKEWFHRRVHDIYLWSAGR